MQIGVIGLGRMGANIARRLIRHGHDCVVYDRDAEPGRGLAAEGATVAGSVSDLAKALAAPRVVWVMLPAGAATEAAIGDLSRLLAAGDTIIDGGNTFWKDDIRRARELKAKGRDTRAEQGYLHAGPSGAGHFVKMIHNGIEYGMMQAMAEGFDILQNARSTRVPEELRLTIDVADVAEVWRRGSVITSWLLDLTAAALAEDAALAGYSGHVEDSGEGRWTVQAAIEEAVPAEVLTAALFARFRSRQDHTFAEKVLSAMRKGFGGHVEPKAGG
jgi:6-phosphogluconate dehydrogenase